MDNSTDKEIQQMFEESEIFPDKVEDPRTGILHHPMEFARCSIHGDFYAGYPKCPDCQFWEDVKNGKE